MSAVESMRCITRHVIVTTEGEIESAKAEGRDVRPVAWAPIEQHEWIDITAISDGETREICKHCGLEMVTRLGPPPIIRLAE